MRGTGWVGAAWQSYRRASSTVRTDVTGIRARGGPPREEHEMTPSPARLGVLDMTTATAGSRSRAAGGPGRSAV